MLQTFFLYRQKKDIMMALTTLHVITMIKKMTMPATTYNF